MLEAPVCLLTTQTRPWSHAGGPRAPPACGECREGPLSSSWLQSLTCPSPVRPGSAPSTDSLLPSKLPHSFCISLFHTFHRSFRQCKYISSSSLASASCWCVTEKSSAIFRCRESHLALVRPAPWQGDSLYKPPSIWEKQAFALSSPDNGLPTVLKL